MEKKILFLDLDGTLLNDAKEITDENQVAIQKAIHAGHAVVVTTGRPRGGISAQINALEHLHRGDDLREQCAPGASALRL